MGIGSFLISYQKDIKVDSIIIFSTRVEILIQDIFICIYSKYQNERKYNFNGITCIRINFIKSFFKIRRDRIYFVKVMCNTINPYLSLMKDKYGN